MEQLKVFVSHTHTDNEFCGALVRALRGAGADVWYDEHNMGAGQLLDEITRELRARPIFLIILSKAAFDSKWVKQECRWAFNLYNREPNRLILPVTAGSIAPADFDALLYLEDFKRIEAPGFQPFPRDAAISRTLRTLALTPRGEAPAPLAPQPTETADDLIARGKSLTAQKDYAAAIPLFERATRLDTHNFSAWFNLGCSLGQEERFVDGLAAFDRALAINNRDGAAWNNKGLALRDLKRPEQALVALDRALVLEPYSARAWNNKGLTLRDLKRYDEALLAYERALSFDSDLPDAWNGKGSTLLDLKRHDEALVAYDRALALEPNDAMLYRNRADLLYEYLHRYREALSTCERALSLDNTSIRGWAILGDVRAALGQTVNAAAAYQAAISLPAQGALGWSSHGRALIGLSRYSTALDAFNRALSLDPQDADSWRLKAHALQMLGRTVEAQEADRRAKELDG